MWLFEPILRSNEPIRGKRAGLSIPNARTRTLRIVLFPLWARAAPSAVRRMTVCFHGGPVWKEERAFAPSATGTESVLLKMRPLIPKCTLLVRSVRWHLCFVQFVCELANANAVSRRWRVANASRDFLSQLSRCLLEPSKITTRRMRSEGFR